MQCRETSRKVYRRDSSATSPSRSKSMNSWKLWTQLSSSRPSVMVSSEAILNAAILIVDDKEANVLLLRGLLRIAGYTQVSSTLDPATVCALHRENRYDLILLDLQMPGMDGFEVMEGLKVIEADG